MTDDDTIDQLAKIFDGMGADQAMEALVGMCVSVACQMRDPIAWQDVVDRKTREGIRVCTAAMMTTTKPH
jgi:hypothetical protein